METRELARSIRSCLARSLTFEEVGGAWALRDEDVLVGSLVKTSREEVRCDTRDGTWRFLGSRGSRFVVRPLGSDTIAARYLPHLRRGGRIEMAGERRYQLRPPPLWAEAWRVTESFRGPAFVTIEPAGYRYRVGLGEAGRMLLDLPLLTMLSLRAVLLETSWAALGEISMPALGP